MNQTTSSSNGNSNVGEQIRSIIQEPPQSPYPVFAGDQETAYQSINQQLASQHGIVVSDFRDVYADPQTYPPSTILTYVATMQQPSGVTHADWSAVQSQIETELSDLVNLDNFQTQSEINANSLTNEFNNRFSIA
jgi:hypothetical protein